MQRRSLIILGVLFATAVILRVVYWVAPSHPSRVIIGEYAIIVEVAATPEDRARGLAGRIELPSDRGMLFLFPERGFHRFWMKGMLFPIDIVWIDAGKIVAVTPDVTPSQTGASDTQLPFYTPPSPVTMVLEVSAGTARRLGWEVGDAVEMEL